MDSFNEKIGCGSVSSQVTSSYNRQRESTCILLRKRYRKALIRMLQGSSALTTDVGTYPLALETTGTDQTTASGTLGSSSYPFTTRTILR